ncbi:MAG TPA: hypothetical protein VIS57_12800, partial [Xanthomonadales bacterium]
AENIGIGMCRFSNIVDVSNSCTTLKHLPGDLINALHRTLELAGVMRFYKQWCLGVGIAKYEAIRPLSNAWTTQQINGFDSTCVQLWIDIVASSFNAGSKFW